MSLDASNPNRVVLSGTAALLACVRRHPRAIRELRLTREAPPALREAVQSAGIAAELVAARDVAELAGHPAVAAAVTARPVLGLAKVSDFAEWRDENATVVVADDFDDPSDLAGVVRAMATFGSRRLLLAGTSERLAFDPALWDESRGALESVRLIRAPALPGLLKLVTSNTVVIGLARGMGRSLREASPVRAPGRHNLVLLSPGGVSAGLQPKVEHLLRIPGSTEHPLAAGDATGIVLNWLGEAGAPPAPGRGFLARKRARQAGKDAPKA